MNGKVNDLERYGAGSLVARIALDTEGNRTHELGRAAPRGAAVMLHGLTNAPYFLGAVGRALHERGFHVVIKEARRIGRVKVVSMDGIKPILDAIEEGVIDSSSATIPRMQGSMAILMLWQASLGVQLPQAIDTGIDVITQENVHIFLGEAI